MAKAGYTAEIDISSMETTDFAWLDMTDADEAAVAAFRAALLAHEEGQFAAVEAVLAHRRRRSPPPAPPARRR
jgi:hypothetical protein